MLWLFIKQSWQGYHYYDIPDMTTAQYTLASTYDISNQLLYNPIVRTSPCLRAFAVFADHNLAVTVGSCQGIGHCLPLAA